MRVSALMIILILTTALAYAACGDDQDAGSNTPPKRECVRKADPDGSPCGEEPHPPVGAKR